MALFERRREEEGNAERIPSGRVSRGAPERANGKELALALADLLGLAVSKPDRVVQEGNDGELDMVGKVYVGGGTAGALVAAGEVFRGATSVAILSHLHHTTISTREELVLKPYNLMTSTVGFEGHKDVIGFR